jgi:hypothetical protein
MQQVANVIDDLSGPSTVFVCAAVHPFGQSRAGLKVKLWQGLADHSDGRHEYQRGSTSSCQAYVCDSVRPARAWKRVEQKGGGVHMVVRAGVLVTGSSEALWQVDVTAIVDLRLGGTNEEGEDDQEPNGEKKEKRRCGEDVKMMSDEFPGGLDRESISPVPVGVHPCTWLRDTNKFGL